MTSYRRLRRPGATYFFTLCLQQRGSALLVEQIELLRHAWRLTMRELPVTCRAVVVLPDHLHAIWTEPEDAALFSERWRRIKARFSRGIEGDFQPRPSLRRKRERGIWQRRFWEHRIRDDRDLADAMQHCRWNPVRHGFAATPEAWPYSSFSRARR